MRGVVLLNLSGSQNQDLVVVQNGVQPVGDRDHGAIGELLSNGALPYKIKIEFQTECIRLKPIYFLWF